MEDFLQIGDKFRSEKLAYGHVDSDEPGDKEIIIDGEPQSHTATFYRDEEERLRHAADTGKILPKTYEKDLGAYDPSRGLAHFVVTLTEHRPGRLGLGGMDQGSPEEQIVHATRLAEEDLFDPNGEQIRFYQQGWGDNILPEDIEFLGKMQQRFI